MKNIFENISAASQENETRGKKIIDFNPEREWDEQEKLAIKIIEKIQGAGHEAYFAGGAVRDYIKGKEPKDIDICTSANSETIKKIIGSEDNCKLYYKSDKAKENKIINVQIGKFEFEIATFRKDVYLPEDVSKKIASIENEGFSKLLIENETEYEDFRKEIQNKEEIEFLSEDEIMSFSSPECKFEKNTKEGVYTIKYGENILEVLFYKKNISKIETAAKENEDLPAHKEDGHEKKQKHVAGRHPDFSVTKGVKLEDDAARRDFTMNGLYYDPINKKIIDTVGGCEDIENKMIRFIGNAKERIGEDQMRIIRFFRFKNDGNLEANKESLQAIRDWVSDEETKEEFRGMFCLNQRLKQEFGKILKSDNKVEILDDLMNEKVLELILPQVAKMKGVEQPVEHHAEGDVWEHTKKCLGELINFKDYKTKYAKRNFLELEKEFLAMPFDDKEDLLPIEDYLRKCKEKNISANEEKYAAILDKWHGKTPAKEDYIEEFSTKSTEEIEREYIGLAWSVLLHDTGKTESKKEDSGKINFHKHEKASVEISQFVLYIEKEAKWHRGKGLSTKGKRLEGLNYDAELADGIVWLVSNHMHHIDFQRMSPVKQRQLMENKNFDRLLELWRADIFGSKPLNTENFDAAMQIYEEFKKNQKEIKSEIKKEDIMKPDELMKILEDNGIDIQKGLVRSGEYVFSRAIPAMIEWLNNKSLIIEKEKKVYTKEEARSSLLKLIKANKKEEAEENFKNIFEEIAKNADADSEIMQLRNSIINVSGKKKNRQIEKLLARINNRANEILVSYFENMGR